MSRAPATVAEAWQDYADDVFPIDVDEKAVTPVRRAYMHALLTAARMVEAGAKPAAIRAECIGYATTIGRQVERAR